MTIDAKSLAGSWIKKRHYMTWLFRCGLLSDNFDVLEEAYLAGFAGALQAFDKLAKGEM